MKKMFLVLAVLLTVVGAAFAVSVYAYRFKIVVKCKSCGQSTRVTVDRDYESDAKDAAASMLSHGKSSNPSGQCYWADLDFTIESQDSLR